MKKKPRDKKPSALGDFFKKVNVASKKNAEKDKGKKVNKQREKETAVFKPKGYTNRKLGVIFFWGTFSIFGAMSVVNFVGGGGEESIVQEASSSSESFNYRGAEYGRDFLQVYFNWEDDDESLNNRIELLKHYTTPNVSNDKDFNSITTEWSSKLSRDDITLIDTQFVSDTRSIYTYKVASVLSKSLGEYEEVVVMNESTEQKNKRLEAENAEESDAENATDEQADESITDKVNAELMRVEKPKEQKDDIKYVSVVVDYVEDLNRFVVTELPSLVGYNLGLQVATENKTLEEFEMAERHDSDAINAFLTTFFKSYSEDDYDKLSYILKDEDFSEGLLGTVSFDSIRHSSVYKSPKNENEFIAKVNVGYIDEEIGQKHTSTYHLVIEKTSDKHVVNKINDMKYIEGLLKNNDESSSEDKSEKTEKTESEDATSSEENSDATK